MYMHGCTRTYAAREPLEQAWVIGARELNQLGLPRARYEELLPLLIATAMERVDDAAMAAAAAATATAAVAVAAIAAEEAVDAAAAGIVAATAVGVADGEALVRAAAAVALRTAMAVVSVSRGAMRGCWPLL